MADSIRTKTLDGVLVQENGIIRNSKGYFLARLEYETEFDSEHINENPVSLADQLAAAQAESEDLSYELASAKAEIASWAKRWPETCASLENLQAEIARLETELKHTNEGMGVARLDERIRIVGILQSMRGQQAFGVTFNEGVVEAIEQIEGVASDG